MAFDINISVAERASKGMDSALPSLYSTREELVFRAASRSIFRDGSTPITGIPNCSASGAVNLPEPHPRSINNAPSRYGMTSRTRLTQQLISEDVSAREL